MRHASAIITLHAIMPPAMMPFRHAAATPVFAADIAAFQRLVFAIQLRCFADVFAAADTDADAAASPPRFRQDTRCHCVISLIFAAPRYADFREEAAAADVDAAAMLLLMPLTLIADADDFLPLMPFLR